MKMPGFFLLFFLLLFCVCVVVFCLFFMDCKLSLFYLLGPSHVIIYAFKSVLESILKLDMWAPLCGHDRVPATHSLAVSYVTRSISITFLLLPLNCIQYTKLDFWSNHLQLMFLLRSLAK